MSPSDTFGPYGFSPYRASMTSEAFRISIHSDAYQAVSPTSDAYHTPPSAISRSTPSQYSVPTAPSVVLAGSYLNLAAESSEDVGHLPMARCGFYILPCGLIFPSGYDLHVPP
ncbi:hypothetical protein BN14_02865 [Rhizoctonia solani AG-1 IB]|uniref:Uncharacterized protein n=1 Tax=Thanatephorus cucumeris (strain AG1-IB / isolate 7/3/14) TaxID=1108050 RepID=M5BYS7_THACB|nr:hypothetical protein BN14_02865 [Rhizoctonia solani AG-1 IB]